jgi:hypothetical protein
MFIVVIFVIIKPTAPQGVAHVPEKIHKPLGTSHRTGGLYRHPLKLRFSVVIYHFY